MLTSENLAPTPTIAALSYTLNASVPALFCTSNAVVAEVAPVPLTCKRADGDAKSPTIRFELDEL